MKRWNTTPLALLIAPFAVASSPLAAQTTDPSPALTMEQSGAVKCSAAFAIVSYRQVNGDEQAIQYGQIDERGREFFVRTLAKLSDETGMDRDAVAEIVTDEAQKLLDEDQIDNVMPACLLMLEASGI